jgi:5-methyltetrahydrofolate--homocysteine methyltransferase
MPGLIEELAAAGPVVTDGAWGTQLQARGLEVGRSPDAWNLSHPDWVEEIGRAYVEAGSQVIITNTFQANRLALERHGLTEKTAEINRAGAEISCRAAAGRARVFGSIGPSGKVLLMDETTEDELREVFGEQARALAEGGAEAIVVETMSEPDEAKAALSAALETGLPVVACMTFDSGKDLDRTSFGTTPEQAAKLLVEAGAHAIGANCGQGLEGYVAICKRLKAATDRPVWIKANAGLPEVVGGKTVWSQTPERFASFVPALVEAGASFIGGCCGTGPEFIRAVRERLSR